MGVKSSGRCDECGEVFDDVFPNRKCGRSSSGLDFPFRQLGYYGGFIDNVPWEQWLDEEDFHLCHDCCVKLLNALPNLFKKIQNLFPLGTHQAEKNICPMCYIAQN